MLGRQHAAACLRGLSTNPARTLLLGPHCRTPSPALTCQVLGPHPGTHDVSCIWTPGPFSPRAEPVPQGEAGRSTGNQNTQAERHPSPSVNWLSAGPLLVENARPKSHAIHPTMPSNLPLCGFA